MARKKQSRSRVVKRERNRRERARREREILEREEREREQIVNDMNTFLESEYESFQEWQVAHDTPFDNESNDYIGYDDTDTKRGNTFRQKYGTTNSQYERMRDVFNSDTYQTLKELYKFDSHQLMDTIMHIPSDVSTEDIEYALIQLLNDIYKTNGGARFYNSDDIYAAMEMGFTYEEALYLTQTDRSYHTVSDIGTSAFSVGNAADQYIRTLVANQEMERRARENLRARYEESVRDRV